MFFAMLHDYAVVSTIEVDVYDAARHFFYESVECCLIEFLLAVVCHNAIPHVETELFAGTIRKGNPCVGIFYQYPEAVSFLLNRKASI